MIPLYKIQQALKSLGCKNPVKTYDSAISQLKVITKSLSKELYIAKEKAITDAMKNSGNEDFIVIANYSCRYTSPEPSEEVMQKLCKIYRRIHSTPRNEKERKILKAFLSIRDSYV